LSHAASALVYECPFSAWMIRVLAGFAVSFFFGAICGLIAAVVLGPHGPLSISANPAFVGFAVGALVMVIAQLFLLKAYRRRWRIGEEHLVVEGLLARKTILLDDLVLIEHQTHGKQAFVVFRPHRGAAERLLLRAPDAEECAASLYALCRTGSLMHPDGTVEPPADVAAWQSAARVLHRRCLALLCWYLTAALVTGGFTAWMITITVTRLTQNGSMAGTSILFGSGAATAYCLIHAAAAYRSMKAFRAGCQVFEAAPTPLTQDE
jgi:hypothetical protein